jgi:hypothetical protein
MAPYGRTSTIPSPGQVNDKSGIEGSIEKMKRKANFDLKILKNVLK